MNAFDAIDEAASEDRPSFEDTEEKWFSDDRRTSARRPSQRPTAPPPTIDDSIADGWFCDV
jgi:hypothetical protein